LLIDLDGVLNNYHGNFDKNHIPEIKQGAYKFLERMSKKYSIKIFTTRNKILTVKWLIENKIDRFINDITNSKDLAFLYIDDRCLCFKGDYIDTEKEIDLFKPYYSP